MPDNDFLKPTFELPSYTGRYLVFAFVEGSAGGGQLDVVQSCTTLKEVESIFIIDPNNKRPIGHLDKSGSFDGLYTYIDILDMAEKRFIDINELHFTYRS